MIETLKGYFVGVAHAQLGGSSGFNFFSFNFASTSVNNAQGAVSGLVSGLATWILALAGIIAFIYLIWSGVNYITAGGDSGKATTARQGVINAIIGIIIVVAAWVVVTFAFSLGGTVGNAASNSSMLTGLRMFV